MKITTLKCPDCQIPMRLLDGNPAFSYWLCEHCRKEFEYNVLIEKFTDETKED